MQTTNTPWMNNPTPMWTADQTPNWRQPTPPNNPQWLPWQSWIPSPSWGGNSPTPPNQPPWVTSPPTATIQVISPPAPALHGRPAIESSTPKIQEITTTNSCSLNE
jgi:hypothetical protein